MYLSLCARHSALLSGRVSDEMGLCDSAMQANRQVTPRSAYRNEVFCSKTNDIPAAIEGIVSSRCSCHKSEVCRSQRDNKKIQFRLELDQIMMVSSCRRSRRQKEARSFPSRLLVQAFTFCAIAHGAPQSCSAFSLFHFRFYATRHKGSVVLHCQQFCSMTFYSSLHSKAFANLTFQYSASIA